MQFPTALKQQVPLVTVNTKCRHLHKQMTAYALIETVNLMEYFRHKTAQTKIKPQNVGKKMNLIST